MEKIEKYPKVVQPVWDFLTSIRLTVAVLLVLATTSILGTVIPQNEPLERYYRQFGEVGFRILYALDIFNMYESWWFRLLIALLAVNIVVCSVDRLRSLSGILFVKTPPFRLARFRRLTERPEIRGAQTPAEARPAIEALLGRRYRHARTEETGDGGVAVFAESGRWTRLGVYIVHLSVLLLLAGAMIGSLFGFDGFVNIPEGESVKSIRLRNANASLPLPFEVRCERFSISFHDTGAPKEYRSRLVLIRDGEILTEKDIIVNDPLRFEGINFFQSSYGRMPADIRALRADGLVLSMVSRTSGMEYRRTIRPGEPLEIPEGGGVLVLERLLDNFQFMGRQDLGQALLLTLTPPDGEPAEVRLPVRFPRFDQMRQNARFTFSVVDFPERYYTGLQVTRDPGVPLVYAGFILMILGCHVSFFMSHRQVCAEIVPEPEGCRVAVSGTANRNRPAMKREVAGLAGRIDRALNPNLSEKSA